MSEPARGRLLWIGLRATSEDAPRVVEEAQVVPGQGLQGDHFLGRPGGAGTRQVTLVQASHLADAARELGRDEPLDPGLLRRNLVVDGLQLLELRGRRFRLGEEVVLEGTGGCPPCGRMDANLGPGGKQALDGRGGLTARVLVGGVVRVGDEVVPLPLEEPARPADA